MNPEGQPIKRLGKDDSTFAFQHAATVALQYWWLYALCTLVIFSSCLLYLRYANPIYNISAKILVKDAKTAGDFSATQLFQDIGFLTGNNNMVDNEVELLKSRTLLEKTITDLQLNLHFFAAGKVKRTAVFKDKLPFELVVYNLNEDSLNVARELNYTYIDKIRFSLHVDNKDYTVKYFDTIRLNFGKLVFKPTSIVINDKNSKIDVLVYAIEDAATAIRQTFNVDITNKNVSTIDLSVKDVLKERGELMLNTLIDIYNKMNIEDKNKIADSTIAFIDNRLRFVTQDLNDVEKDIQQFRQQNKLTDLTEQGKLLLSNSSDYYRQTSQQQVQLEVLKSLESFLKSRQNQGQTIPTGLVVQDPSFAATVQTYNQLQLDRYRQLQTTTEANPVVQKLNVQIVALKDNILANLATIRKSMEINLRQLESKNGLLDNELQRVPEKEKTFLEFSRQQGIKQELYLYLLKKREETAVTKAANIANTRVVDAAKSERQPSSPKKNLLLLAALFFSVVVPSAGLYAKQLLNTKLETKADISTRTEVPILGQMGRSNFKEALFATKYVRHPLTEQLRQLKNNLDFILSNNNTGLKTILFTSSMTGEGKSFLALNLAGLLSMSNKKVIILEFDLRKPKITKELSLVNTTGITNFLTKQKTDLMQLAVDVPGVPNLKLLSSGPIPPNPAELIGYPTTKEMFDILEKEFDYIIIDAPPIGVVTDAQVLAPFTDVTLYVVRQGYTYKDQLELIQTLYIDKKFTNLGIVVNDIQKQRGFGYGYSYSSDYKYGYGYE